jgi:hypothetical protein
LNSFCNKYKSSTLSIRNSFHKPKYNNDNFNSVKDSKNFNFPIIFDNKTLNKNEKIFENEKIQNEKVIENDEKEKKINVEKKIEKIEIRKTYTSKDLDSLIYNKRRNLPFNLTNNELDEEDIQTDFIKKNNINEIIKIFVCDKIEKVIAQQDIDILRKERDIFLLNKYKHSENEESIEIDDEDTTSTCDENILNVFKLKIIDLLSNGFIKDDCLTEIQNLFKFKYSEVLKKYKLDFIHPNNTTLFQTTKFNNKKKELIKNEYYLGILNYLNFHWIQLFFCKKEKIILVFDNAHDLEYQQTSYEKLIMMLSLSINFDLKKIIYMKFENQNGCECGIYAINLVSTLLNFMKDNENLNVFINDPYLIKYYNREKLYVELIKNFKV